MFCEYSEQIPVPTSDQPTPSVAELTTVPQTTPIPLSCGYNGSVSRYPVSIRSPNYPNLYQENALCEWRLQANTTGYILVLEFRSFETEANYDFVTVSFKFSAKYFKIFVQKNIENNLFQWLWRSSITLQDFRR